MMSLTSIVTLALVCTMAYAQRPGFAPNPWDAMYTQTVDQGTFTTSRPQVQSGNTGVGGNGLVDRFGSNDNDGMVFRYFNNVPIQGPEAPCIGCNYRLTNRGFVRISTVNKQQVQQSGTGSYSG
ncbi:hypothetical protein B566_EDAN007539 [Ephemera danica]|nr:hypothetical protein B566_EDAN007539 [Ephemera danica]